MSHTIFRETEKFFHRLASWFRGLLAHNPFVAATGTDGGAEPETISLPASPIWIDPDRIKPTKAYADQRQKMPHNRRRKPKKAMRNLYQLA